MVIAAVDALLPIATDHMQLVVPARAPGHFAARDGQWRAADPATGRAGRCRAVHHALGDPFGAQGGRGFAAQGLHLLAGHRQAVMGVLGIGSLARSSPAAPVRIERLCMAAS
jgi:hypothetical protein